MKNLLIVDDEQSICNALKFAFEDDYNIYLANNIMEFNRVVDHNQIDIALVDLNFGNISGLDLIKKINILNRHAIIIMITAYGTIESAIQAIKSGAYDYVLKPIDLDMLKELLMESKRYYALKKNLVLDKFGESETTTIVGSSEKIYKVLDFIDKVKNLDVTILIKGETGTGKDLVAREIHLKGLRKNGPFIAINCGALPDNLVESELFGYEKGAFTGADKSKKGAFELSNGGSIFLDEIGEMSLANQVKLLRAIEKKEITPIGSEKTIKVDVRVIAATNKDLDEAIRNKEFRSDLFYRLNILPINLPTLNDRKDDIPLLITYFINKANKLYNLNIRDIEDNAVEFLQTLNYKGNVRELENIIFRACILSKSEIILYDDLKLNQSNDKSIDKEVNYISFEIGTKIEEAEKRLILETLEFVGGNKSKAAELLGISERSIYYKTKDYFAE